jgi:ABC-type antimicrobial peptide transport system permease subunit
VRALDGGLAVSRLVPMSHHGQARLSAVLMLLFGALALLLSGIGVYGVVAYAVAQRTREYGIRLALGETPRGLRRRVLVDGVRLGVPAVLLGVAGALVAARLLDRLLYEVTPADPVTFMVTAALVLATMVTASWVPAWRASRVDPAVALSAE